MQEKIVVIGLGVVGSATFEEIEKQLGVEYKLRGVDVDKKVLGKMEKRFNNSDVSFSDEIPADGDIYIVSVYSLEQVRDVFDNIIKINKSNPLIVIESTISLELTKDLLKKREGRDLVLFPHRYNPNDDEHKVFNLNRILGGADKKSEERGLKFYSKFMSKELIHIFPYLIVALAKPAENAYRFIEIAIAEEWKMECDRLGIDFKELRRAINTKWNINLKEAQDGINGLCLPKDTKLMKDMFNKSDFIKTALEVDERYRKFLAE